MSAQAISAMPYSLAIMLVEEATKSDRERLADHICSWVRLMAPSLPFDEYMQFRARVHKTSLPVLREILEQDVLGEAARELLPQMGAR